MTRTRKTSAKSTPALTAMKILVVDIGGSNVKCLASGQSKRRKFSSDPGLTPDRLVEGVLNVTAGWDFDRLSIGYPGVVRHGLPVREPHNLGRAGSASTSQPRSRALCASSTTPRCRRSAAIKAA